MRVLKDNQIKAEKKLSKYKVGALFMEAGTGKTQVAYNLITSTKVDYVLYMTPFQTKTNLSKELEKCGGLEVDIQGIESLSNSDRLYLELHNKLQGKKVFMIVDESLKIKNPDAKRTQRIIELGKLAEYKLILNGTPISRSLLDIWSQMEFLSPKILNMSYTMFKNAFVEYTIITKQTGNIRWTKEFINKYHNVDYLYKLISPFTFEANLELDKKKQYITLDYELSNGELKEHKALKEKYLDDEVMQALNNNIFLMITQKMQHNYSLSAEKFTIVKKLLKENKGKFIIFAKYIETQEVLKETFKDCLVLSWQKHSFGLNLQEYNNVIFWDKTWDYALVEQAEHRVYRLGQKDDCRFWQLQGEVGLEIMMQNNINTKGKLLKNFKNKAVKELMKKL